MAEIIGAYRDDSDAGLTADLVAIDRLSGQPFGESLSRIWTIEEIKTVAEEMGKAFQPNPEIADRLEDDLANGALVLFNESDVLQAITSGLVPENWQEDLINLVTYLSDIAVIPIG